MACNTCGLVRVSPRPDLHELYAGYIEAGHGAAEAVQRKLDRKNVRSIHRTHVKTAIAACTTKPLKLFDMGCGAGTMLMEAKELGLEAWGNEVNKAAVDLLNGMGFNVWHGFTFELDLPVSQFDIVTNFDYLEHSYTPLEDLKTCFEISKPGGILYLKTLYLDCPAHKEKGENWQLFGLGHFHFFSVDVLKKMVESVGYKIKDVRVGGLVFILAERPLA